MPKTPKSERIFEKPVAWLVGRDLLGGIKGILLYTAYGSKLDPRDWMTGNVIPFEQPSRQDKTEFWFDYIADAGDGTKAMYSIAYLTMSDLWTDGKQGVAFEDEKELKPLPRGEFLFFGGDTAYHVADYLTLGNRIQRPFTYAFEDLMKYAEPSQQPVFGIPGNHDYYDQVDGFRRQFRKPVRPEPPPPPLSPGGDNAQLGIAGYYRAQEASYVAIKLPFGWWLWGLDTETGPLDNRQRDFFLALGDEDKDGKVLPPKKLIIATSSPSTTFGKVADEENDFKATQAIKELLGPAQPFLPTKQKDGTYDFSQTGDVQIQEGQCRLDISGDVHHYARYWGPKPQPPIAAREHAKAPTPTAESYASVVSGLGGAFHHPSNTYDDELQEQVLYPTEKVSREFVGKELFNFWSITTGGYVWLFGFIIAFLIYFAASVTQSSRQDLSNVGPLPGVHLNLVQREPIMPTTARPKTEDPCAEVRPWVLFNRIKITDGWTPPEPCNRDRPYYFFITSLSSWPKDLLLGTLLIFLSLGATMTTFGMSKWLFGRKDDQDPKKRAAARIATPNPNKKLWVIVPPAAIAVFLGMITVERYRDHVTPFVSSLLVLFTMIIAAGGIVLTVRYNDYLFQKGHDDYVTKWDRFWPWALPVLSVLVFAAGLSSFGRNNLPALLVTDILFSLVFVGALFALIILPVMAGGELLYTFRPRWLGFVGKLLIGLWHAILQLVVPFVLVRRGTYLTWILAAILVVLPMWPAAKLFKSNRRVVLSILWVLYGGLMLALPWLTSQPSPISFFNNGPHFVDPFWFGTRGLVPSALAGVFGAGISCLWFGWYLGICSVFNGHNNEIGGAARIERFKQFIRFRVTEKGLTGYVIAVDDVSMIGELRENGELKDGRDLKPKLIDVFHLKVK